jgi:hypothetical protein
MAISPWGACSQSVFDPPTAFLNDVAESELASELPADFLKFAFPQNSKEIGPVDDALLLLGCQALLQQPLSTLRQRLPYLAAEATVSQHSWIGVNQFVIQPSRSVGIGLAVQFERGEKFYMDRRFAGLHPLIAEDAIQMIRRN